MYLVLQKEKKGKKMYHAIGGKRLHKVIITIKLSALIIDISLICMLLDLCVGGRQNAKGKRQSTVCET